MELTYRKISDSYYSSACCIEAKLMGATVCYARKDGDGKWFIMEFLCHDNLRPFTHDRVKFDTFEELYAFVKVTI
jgi:hypothetical protein